MRPRFSPEDQDLGSSATLYCYREQSGGGGGSTEVLPSADVPEGEKPLKAKAHKVGQLNLGTTRTRTTPSSSHGRRRTRTTPSSWLNQLYRLTTPSWASC